MRKWLRQILGTAYRDRLRVIDETEKQCIRAVCSTCREGRMPEWYILQWRWVHHVEGAALQKTYFDCEAHGIYEIRRRREDMS